MVAPHASRFTSMLNSLKISNLQLLMTICAILALGLLAGAAVSLVNPAIAFAALVGAVGAVLLARDAQWGLYGVTAMAVLLPFAAVSLNLGFSPTFLDLVTVLLVGVRL